MSITYSKEVVLPRKFQSEVSKDGLVGKFSVYPLQKGFGVTLGNSLRRVILSTIRGVAVSEIQIDGINHEFTTVNGIVQDVSEMIFNLKKIIFQTSLEDAVLKLSINGPKIVTAGDIECPAGVNIINPSLALFEITSSIKFNMTMKIRAGIVDYYYDLDSNSEEEQELGVIKLDCHFNPIVNVSFDVIDTRLDKKTDYDKLIMHIETNGSIEAEEVFSSAIDVLANFLSSISTLKLNISNTVSDSKHIEDKADSSEYNYNLLRRVADLELSVRSQNCLKLENIEYVGDLVVKTENAMLATPNFGRKSLVELRQILGQMGLKFGMDIEWKPKNFDILFEEAKKFFEAD